ncbi:hypothetical protein N7462_003856 [Penicillium macrosclerotiorum]|uniref:uncharacterized protein n=1 Tax=Penicillium macrosclerotiorum TaxID=303699 RepID=UPI0025494E9F|nr:uncharacterized protein N7462_003856 [Penicillium macrosclerotiorum]KAJ5689464.1 hypothetical protein N7462_003856 [Penicillium macrosclerotiorum]
MTAAQQNRLQEHWVPNAASTISMVVGISNNIEQQTQMEEYEFKQARHARTDRMLTRTFAPPKCAVLFDHLRLAHWGYFGIPFGVTPWFDRRLLPTTADEPHAVHLHRVLSAHLGLLELHRDFAQEAIKSAKESGMTEQAAETFALRKVMLDLGKAIDPKQTDMDIFVKEFDLRIKYAKRIASLVDAIGVTEVLMISFDEDEITLPHDIPKLTSLETDDDEWTYVLSQLLNPSLQLKETCLRLSGIVHMIQELDGMGNSGLRTFLAQEIRRRVDDVFGAIDESDEDDSSMADLETEIF